MDSSSRTQTLGPLLTPLVFGCFSKPSQQQSMPSTHTLHYTLAAKRTIGRQEQGKETAGIEIKAEAWD